MRSITVASGAFVFTDSIPLSRADVEEYISLVPITCPFAALSVVHRGRVRVGVPGRATRRRDDRLRPRDHPRVLGVHRPDTRGEPRGTGKTNSRASVREWPPQARPVLWPVVLMHYMPHGTGSCAAQPDVYGGDDATASQAGSGKAVKSCIPGE